MAEGPTGGPRPLPIVAAAVFAVLLAAGCGRSAIVGGTGNPAAVLAASPQWQRSVDPDAYRTRLADLTAALQQLRTDTGSSWIGRQDDVTGFLAEVRGGTFAPEGATEPEAVVDAFLTGYGQPLFGVTRTDVEIVSSSGAAPDDPSAVIVLRAEQRSLGVPVLDSSLQLTVATRPDPRLRAVTGRVFPSIAVATTPAIGQPDAVATAQDVIGGQVSGRVRLVIIPAPSPGRLAWEVPLAGAEELGAVVLYVDAVQGGILSIRPGMTEASVSQAASGSETGSSTEPQGAGPGPVTGEPVEISGTGPIGEPETAGAIRTPDGGLFLVDTTTPSYDPSTGTGGIETHDATGLTDQDGLPGPLMEAGPGPPDRDPEALAAQALGRVVLEYYRTVHGRNSWDGRGGTLTSSVHFGGPGFCNSFFNGNQMVFGTRCPGGASATEVEIDTAAHEITHGVTATSVGGSALGLLYTGQSGAMNESFSDYFGNVIGNRLKGTDTAQMFEGACTGITRPTPVCIPDPTGGLSLRYLLNGDTFDDYLYLLDPPFRLLRIGLSQDHGGVHANSLVWSNALWGVRTQLANMDGKTGNDSPRAHLFDAIVYAALTRHLSPTSGFLGGRTAVELSAQELAAPPEMLRVIREHFDRNHICSGCVPEPAVSGSLLAGGPQAEMIPSVSGTRTAWLDLAAGTGVTGIPVVVADGEDPVPLNPTSESFSVGLAGAAAISAELTDGIVRYPPQGGREVLDAIPLSQAGFDSLVLGVAGSADGAAWVDLPAGTVNFVDPDGVVTSADLGSLVFQPFVSIGTGGRTVVLGSRTGTIVRWVVGSDPAVLTRMPGQVLAVGAFGDVAAAIVIPGSGGSASAWLLRPGETTAQQLLSSSAAPFGIAVSANAVVWPEIVGPLGGGVATSISRPLPDTDLFLFDLTTGVARAIAPERGQQGFPAMDGTRLSWQDAARGGDDVRTLDLTLSG